MGVSMTSTRHGPGKVRAFILVLHLYCYVAHAVLYWVQVAVIGAWIRIQVISNLLQSFRSRIGLDYNISLFGDGIDPLKDHLELRHCCTSHMCPEIRAR